MVEDWFSYRGPATVKWSISRAVVEEVPVLSDVAETEIQRGFNFPVILSSH
jgi:hypothetical protein